MNNLLKFFLSMVPLTIIALIITFWNAYTNTNDELMLSKNKNENLQHEKTELKKLVQNEKHEIAKLLDELSRIKMTLAERENKLKEVEADVYRHYKALELLGKQNPAIGNLLNQPITDELWREIYGTAVDANKNCQSNSTGVPTETIPATTAKEPNSAGVGRTSNNTPGNQ